MRRYKRVRRVNRAENNKPINYKRRAAINRIKRRTLSVILLIAVVLIVLKFVPVLKVSNISVVGNEHADATEIIKQSGIKIGDNWIYCPTGRAERNIEKMLYTKSVTVKRAFPNKIKIYFTENTPFGYITDTEGNYLLISQDGIIMAVEDKLPEDRKLAEIIAPNVVDSKPGKTFAPDDENVMTNYCTLTRALKDNNIIDKVTMADVTSGENISIRYNKLKVIFGDMDKLDYKITNLKTILKQLQENAEGRLDLSVPGKSYYRENDAEIDYEKIKKLSEQEDSDADDTDNAENETETDE